MRAWFSDETPLRAGSVKREAVPARHRFSIVKSHPKIINRVLEALRAHQTFCVVGHVRPDGDCVGSQLG
ncbi:MAG: hypothetical protein ACREIC_30215, partial [Limisphaerales bacterium]